MWHPTPPSFAWASDRCTQACDPEQGAFYWLEQVAVADDTAEKHPRNYNNLVRVSAWTGDPADTELLMLTVYLRELPRVENIQTLEKRAWRVRTP